MLAFSWISAQVTYDNFENERRVHYDFVHGGFDQIFLNPHTGGANTSEVCGEYVRNQAEQFDVLVIMPGGIMDDVSDYVSGTKTMSIDIYSPAAGIPVQITLEDSSTAGPTNYPTGRHSVYLTTTTVANQWETLTFQYDSRPDGSVPNTSVTSLILLFNPGTNTNDTYLFDNLLGPEFADPCAGISAAPLTEFEDFECHSNLIYEYNQGWLTKLPNPATGGANPSKFAGEYARNPDLDGTDVMVTRFAGNLDLTTNNQIKMMVYGDTTSVVVSLQDGTTEVLAVTQQVTQANTWQELTFDFSAITNYTGIDHAVLLFDPGDVTFNTYWFDNFRLDGFEMVANDETQLNPLASAKISPNPSNGLFNLDFQLEKTAEVSFTLSDLQGRTLQMPAAARMGVGTHTMPIDASGLAQGVYLWTLQAGELQKTGKLVITR